MKRIYGALLAAATVALPAAAQDATLSLEQMQGKYRRMNAVHILKCDSDGDSRFTRTEQRCVAGVYEMMYIAD
jgi:hypothetical protein